MPSQHKFLELVSAADLDEIEKGLEPGATFQQKKLADAATKSVVARGSKLLPARRKKPGPSRKQTTNAVDDLIRRKILTVKDLLKAPPDTSRSRTLATLRVIVERANQLVDDNLLLTAREEGLATSICDAWSSCWAAYISDTTSACPIPSRVWPGGVRKAPAFTKLVTESLSRTASSQNIDADSEFSALVEVLGLSKRSAVRPANEYQEALIAGDQPAQGGEVQKEIPDAERSSVLPSYRKSGLRRQDILDCGIGRLLHTKRLLDGVEEQVLASDAAGLLRTLEGLETGAPIVNNQGMKEHIIYAMMVTMRNTLISLLQNAISRQAHPSVSAFQKK